MIRFLNVAGRAEHLTILPHRLPAVSYTHLDVYKRQAQAWGLDVAGYQAKDAGQVLAALEQKKLVVVLMWPGHFTASGHFIVLRGLDEDGKVVVADPSSQKRSEVSWDFQLIVDEAAEKAGANGPFWVIG